MLIRADVTLTCIAVVDSYEGLSCVKLNPFFIEDKISGRIIYPNDLPLEFRDLENQCAGRSFSRKLDVDRVAGAL